MLVKRFAYFNEYREVSPVGLWRKIAGNSTNSSDTTRKHTLEMCRRGRICHFFLEAAAGDRSRRMSLNRIGARRTL
jgi:hypothetical protein